MTGTVLNGQKWAGTEMDLPNSLSLKYRRLRGDMTEHFKILNHYCDSNVAPNLIQNKNS